MLHGHRKKHMNVKYNICYFGAIFSDFAEMLRYGLQSLGKDVTVTESIINNKVNVILGAHQIENNNLIPKNSIIVNLEQLKSSPYVTKNYIELMKTNLTWDYSYKNILFLKSLGVSAKKLKFGFCPSLERVKSGEYDIDVLFYGSVNKRRLIIINKLISLGLRVVVIDGVKIRAIGKELDKYIARSRVVLNMHFYEDSIFEIVRVSFLLINRKAVVAEVNDDTEIDEDLIGCIYPAKYEDLVSACVYLLDNETKRKSIEDNGYYLYKLRNQGKYLEVIMSMIQCENVYTLPKIINLGSGKSYLTNALNIDINNYWKPDLVADLSCAESLLNEFNTKKFGLIKLENGYFDEIIANEVLEHVENLSILMKNCLDLLREGGIFNICVPYDLSYGAWQDPTHVRAFNERSWWYYTNWYWYMGWTEYRFEMCSLVYVLNEFGVKLQQEGKSTEEIVRTPRAVDSMNVKMKKITLSNDEKEFVNHYLTR